MEENTPVEENKFERPEVKITAKDYWEDAKARWGIHRYEWQEASKELKEIAEGINQSDWFITSKRFVKNTSKLVWDKIQEVATLESTPAGEKVEEETKDDTPNF